MNVEDYEAAALHEIVDRVESEAACAGVEVAGAELVGLMPGRGCRVGGGRSAPNRRLQPLRSVAGAAPARAGRVSCPARS